MRYEKISRMKQFLAFYFAEFYPEGGMNDFVGDFDDIADAFASVEEQRRIERIDDNDWENSHGQVIDTTDRILYIKQGKEEAFVWKPSPLRS